MTSRKNPGRGDGIDSFHRYWAMLSKVPREPRSVDTSTLIKQLERDDIDVSPRTIQRDLDKLALRFPGLVCNKKSRPYQWQWQRNAPSFLIPPMNLESAVTLELVSQHLRHVLPRSSASAFSSLFEQAQKTIELRSDALMAQWPKKVRAIPVGYPREAPPIKRQVLDRVYEALLDERQLLVKYQAHAAPAPKESLCHPLGLVQRSGLLYLVCCFKDYDNVVAVLLHRMHSAEVLPAKRRRPKGFKLDEFISSGALGFSLGEPIKLRARVADAIARTLVESKLAKDQTLRPDEPGWEKLTATVNNSMELRGWLRSLGPLIEVLGPKKLRDELKSDAAALVKLYR